jgi:VCBS repeat-containing protein
VTESNGTASVEFDFNNDQINLTPGETLTQSYNVSVADAQNPAENANQTVSVTVGGPGNDNFVFAPGIGADTITNFNPQQDTIELDHFANVQTVQELESLVTTDAHGDAMINLGNHDSIALPGTTSAQLLQIIQAGHVLLH